MSAIPVDARACLLEWVRDALVPLSTVVPGPPWDDLAPLCDMLGDADVVGLSEGVHCAAEPLEFRNRLFQYLVERHGFTAIAIESGSVESRVVYDYSRGQSGDLSAVLENGISWGMHQLPQNRALVTWLREYNARHGQARKVNFYGFDVPGSLACTQAVRSHDTALTEVLHYLGDVDTAASVSFRARLEPLTRALHFSLQGSNAPSSYERLTQAERDTLTGVISDLIAWLERHEAEYVASTTASDHAWAYRAAIGARQVDSWLRQVPVGWRPANVRTAIEEALETFYPAAADVRERAQADNLEWIVAQERPRGKVLVFASRYHLSSAPIKPTVGGKEQGHAQQVAGTYLRRRFGSQWLAIGNLIGGGQAACGDYRETLPRAATASIDGLAAEAGTRLFLLDLRKAPSALAPWLNEERCLVAGNQTLKVPVGRAFDILFYIDTVTPACPRPVHADVRGDR